MFARLLALFRTKDSLVWERDRWKQRAIIREEHIEYWQEVAKFYRQKWNEALDLLPPEKVEELTKDL